MAVSVQTIVEIMLAISLSAAAGFRVFIPLLALSTASVLGHVNLPDRFDWIENPQAMTLFAIAAVLEIIGYSIPWFDHLLDIVATPAAILSGTIVAASLAPEMDPLAKWVLALTFGGGVAGITKGLMNLLRGGSTAATGGIANPIFAFGELAIAVVLSVLAIATPVIAGALVMGIVGFGVYKIIQFVNQRKSTVN